MPVDRMAAEDTAGIELVVAAADSQAAAVRISAVSTDSGLELQDMPMLAARSHQHVLLSSFRCCYCLNFYASDDPGVHEQPMLLDELA